MLNARGKSLWRVILFRTFLILFTIILFLAGGLFGAVVLINYGPSPAARDLLVMTSLETSALKFLATSFFSEEELEHIISDNSIHVSSEITDVNKIKIPNKDEKTTEQINSIEIKEISGPTYRGRLMIVKDPSRVSVGTSYPFGKDCKGKSIETMMEENNAIAAINGGGFEDIGGVGNGGTPIGIVIRNGVLQWGYKEAKYDLIGFDNENRLILGTMTGGEALEKGVRDALSFGPFLIINGKPSQMKGTAGGLNPRTAIGQRADGAVLLLTIDGRQTGSLGANYGDLIKIMQEFGAVNAANLDGGSSSAMYYEGELISISSSLYGVRDMPTCILVSE